MPRFPDKKRGSLVEVFFWDGKKLLSSSACRTSFLTQKESCGIELRIVRCDLSNPSWRSTVERGTERLQNSQEGIFKTNKGYGAEKWALKHERLLFCKKWSTKTIKNNWVIIAMNAHGSRVGQVWLEERATWSWIHVAPYSGCLESMCRGKLFCWKSKRNQRVIGRLRQCIPFLGPSPSHVISWNLAKQEKRIRCWSQSSNNSP